MLPDEYTSHRGLKHIKVEGFFENLDLDTVCSATISRRSIYRYPLVRAMRKEVSINQFLSSYFDKARNVTPP